MNNPGYREEALSIWQEILNLLRLLVGLPRIEPTLIAEMTTSDWQPFIPKCLPAPKEYPLLPAPKKE
ncbi:MAG: hypothetical protein HN736_17720 [Anaerolineae bacterium]|jgi:hypothetical protein|nr:hypothetical protein [Anaerolineae bacterium]MBT7776536.1 hypothetical protein [Anaerolineae bacterium]